MKKPKLNSKSIPQVLFKHILFAVIVGTQWSNCFGQAAEKRNFEIWEAQTTDSVCLIRMYENEGLLNVFFIEESNKKIYSFCIDIRYYFFEHPDDSILSRQSLFQVLLQNNEEIDSIAGKNVSIAQVKLLKSLEMDKFSSSKIAAEVYRIKSKKGRPLKVNTFLIDRGYMLTETQIDCFEKRTEYVTNCSSCSPNGFMTGSYPLSKCMKNLFLDTLKLLMVDSSSYFNKHPINEFRYVIRCDSLGNVNSIVPKSNVQKGGMEAKMFALASLITKVNPYYFYENSLKDQYNIVGFSDEFEMRVTIIGSVVKLRYYYKGTRAVETIYGDVDRI